MKGARRKFIDHRHRAARRGIEWHLTFEEWCEIWRKSGQWENRGVRRGQYVMARNWDAGPYAAWNVDIQLSAENVRTGMIWKRSRRVKTEWQPVRVTDGERADWMDPLAILEAQEERACNQD